MIICGGLERREEGYWREAKNMVGIHMPTIT